MREKIYFPAVLCIAVVALLGAAWESSFAQTKEPIKIGVIANMGWPVGKSAAQAVQLGVKKVNDEGGLLGRPLKLIEADSKGIQEIGNDGPCFYDCSCRRGDPNAGLPKSWGRAF
jgi:hypothetical protein